MGASVTRAASLAVAIWLGCGALAAAHAVVLITEEEAALPDDQLRARGFTRGPSIVVVSPPPTAGSMTSPVTIRIRFEGRGGIRVDPDTAVITYIKDPPIDLTARSRQFISANGITIGDAVVP